MYNSLTIRFNIENEETVESKVLFVCSNEKSIEKLILWIMDYNRGNFDESGNVICSTLSDFKACQQKALVLNLLPKMSNIEIRERFSK